MIRLRDLVLGVVVGAVGVTAVVAATSGATMDPVALSPDLYKVRFENERVRVLEYRLPPGGKEPMHSHPAGLVYVLAGGSLKNGFPDGTSSTRTAVTGEVIWREAITHSGENLGSTEIGSLVIDLKK
jgi:quercetin dioxygenase-like cupin family protein